jgi:trimethylamine--corrinoid protein Co-methyltransferase
MKKFFSELALLRREEIEKIHEASVKILVEIGMHVPDEEVLHLLEKNGCSIQWERQVVRFSEVLIQNALESIKKDFKQAPTYFDRHIELNRGNIILWMCSMPEVIDLSTNVKRRGTHEDMMKGIAVGNVLPNVGVIEPHGIPAEVPSHVVDVYCYRYLYAYSRKPCSTWIYSERSAAYILEMAKVVAEAKGETHLPLYYFADTVSPLRYARHTLQIMKLMARHGVPVYIGPMVTAGGSGPVTLAGTVALCNAEVLSQIALVWLLNPKQALVYPGISTILDLRNALISYGAPEQVLCAIGAVQMAKHYGMACCCNIHISDANLCDFQRGYEAAATAAFALSAGVEMIGIVGYGAAGLMSSNPGCTSLEQLVIDNECADYLKRILRGFDVTDETLAVDLIREVGIGGTFIDKEHTVKHMRNEHFFPELLNRDAYSVWKEKGATSIGERAKEKLKEILKRHYPPQPVLDTLTERTLEEIYREAASDKSSR